MGHRGRWPRVSGRLVTASELGPQARLHHTHIFASDIDETLRFWTTWLGAEVVADEVLLGSRNVMVAVGDGRLNIYAQPPSHPERSGGVHHLGIQVRDLHSLVGEMRAGGVVFRKPIAEGEGFRYVMVEAPDRILLELFESVPDQMPDAAETWFSWPQ